MMLFCLLTFSYSDLFSGKFCCPIKDIWSYDMKQSEYGGDGTWFFICGLHVYDHRDFNPQVIRCLSKWNIWNYFIASPRGRSNEETCHSAAEEQVHSCERVGTSSEMVKNNLNNTRYFVIKSLNHQNLQMSIKMGIWATQVMNEPILEEAFQVTFLWFLFM